MPRKCSHWQFALTLLYNVQLVSVADVTISNAGRGWERACFYVRYVAL